MGLYKKGSIWWTKFQVQGQSVHRSTRQTKKAEAQLVEDRWRRDILMGDYVAPSEEGLYDTPEEVFLLGHTLERYAREVWETKEKSNHVLTYLGNARTTFRDFFGSSWEKKDIRLIDTTTCQEFKQSLTGSNSTKNNKLNYLRAILKRAYTVWRYYGDGGEELPLIPSVPYMEQFKRTRPEVKFFEEDQLEELWGAFEREDFPKKEIVKSLCEVLLDTGMRVGEALDLSQKDIRLADKEIYVRAQKGEDHRTIPMTTRVVFLLQDRLKEDSEKVFPLHVRKVQRDFAKVRQVAGLPDSLTIHSLRHTFGRRLINKGANIYTVSKLMGHSDIQMTQRYLSVQSVSTRSAISLLE